MKRIILDYGKCSALARSMQVTRETVSRALSYKKNSELARKIRYVAKTQYDGIEIGR